MKSGLFYKLINPEQYACVSTQAHQVIEYLKNHKVLQVVSVYAEGDSFDYATVNIEDPNGGNIRIYDNEWKFFIECDENGNVAREKLISNIDAIIEESRKKPVVNAHELVDPGFMFMPIANDDSKPVPMPNLPTNKSEEPVEPVEMVYPATVNTEYQPKVTYDKMMNNLTECKAMLDFMLNYTSEMVIDGKIIVIPDDMNEAFRVISAMRSYTVNKAIERNLKNRIENDEKELQNVKKRSYELADVYEKYARNNQ